MDKHYRIYAMGMIILPLLLIVSLLLTHILLPEKAFSESENRVLAKRPSLSWRNIISGKYTSRYEEYISDQFPFRDYWIGMKSASERLLGKKENNDVFLGKDGYLLQKFNAPDNKTLKSRIEILNSFGDALSGKDIYFMLVPNSVKIMDGKLPQNAPVDDELIYIKKIEEDLDNEISIVDVYNILWENNNEAIYYKTDHHWTSKGAYLGYGALMKTMGQIPKAQSEFSIRNVSHDFYGSLYSKSGFRSIRPDSMELYIPKNPIDYSIEHSDQDGDIDSIYHMENLNKKDKYTVFLGGNDSLVKITTDIDNGRKLLVIKDSYANSMVPFLIHHYKEIYLVDPRYHRDSILELAQKNHIDDVVILYNVISFFEDNSIINITQ